MNKGVIQWLCNAMGVCGVRFRLLQRYGCVRMYSLSLLLLQGGGVCEIPRKKRYVTLEWPLIR